MSSQRPLPLALPTLLVVVLLVGCGERIETYPVRGTVTLGDDEPLAGATVSMESTDHSLSATGLTDPQGRFAMGALAPGDGMPRGEYRAAVQPPAAPDPDQPTPPPFDPQYMRYETSGLEFTVDGPVDDIEIRLE